MDLLSMILNVISDGDTSNDILNKMNIEFPDYIKRKTRQKGTKKAGLAQARAEISANIGHNEGNIFSINKNVKPHTYSEIDGAQMDEIFSTYITDVQELERLNKPETAYYYSLKTLLLKFAKKYLRNDNLIIQQEHHSFGVPDFTIYEDKTGKEILGIVECKRPDIDLIKEENHKHKGKQIKRYRREIDNVIFTNFYDFRLYNNDKLEHKVSLLDKDKNVKDIIDNNTIELLKKFLSNSGNKTENKDFIIHGKGLTKKQIKRLETNKTLKIFRGGCEFWVTKSVSKISRFKCAKSEFIKEKFIIDGQPLCEQQIVHLELYGWVAISRNGIEYLIQ